MTFKPQNFVDNVGPAVTAEWLNPLDVTVNYVLGGAQTVADALTALGIEAPTTLPIGSGGTGATSASQALSNLGGLPASAFTNQEVGLLIYPQTTSESAHSVTPTNYYYPPGNPRRYGAVGNGTADDTTAVQNAINCNTLVQFNAGDIYGVQTVTFGVNNQKVDFNSGWLIGIASTATTCIAKITCSYSMFFNYQIFGLGNGSTILNPNPNYTCATWWNNSPAGSSQFNTFYGMLHDCCQRALVYGALPGTYPGGGLQSENSIYGFKTVGCSNPLYNNAPAGFLFLGNPILYSGSESWTRTFPVTARAVECYLGGLFIQGGEIEYASNASGYAAELAYISCVGTNIETAAPILVAGDGVTLVNCGCYNTQSSYSHFIVAQQATGTFRAIGSTFERGASVGSFSRSNMIDATLAGLVTFSGALSASLTGANLAVAWAQRESNAPPGTTFTGMLTFSSGEQHFATFTQGSVSVTWVTALANNCTAIAYLPWTTVLTDTMSSEWGWDLNGSNCKLVQNNLVGQVIYNNHRMNITYNDPNGYYTLNTGTEPSLVSNLILDSLGYTTTGWTLNLNYGGGTTFANTTNVGPPYQNYLASQLTLVATGLAYAQNGVMTNLSTLQSSTQRVQPGEKYWISAWLSQTSGSVGGGGAGLMVNFYNLSGSFVSTVQVSDSTSLGANGTWTFIEGPVPVPATAAYMAPGVLGSVATVSFTDFRIRRA